MKAAVAVCAAALAGAAAQNVQPPGRCDPSYDCFYQHVDNTGTLYEYDFTNLCSPMGYSTNDTSGHTYHFNICGTTFDRCIPKGYRSTYVYGAAMQIWGDPPSCNLDAPECFDTYRNASSCCTRNCEVLGVGTPLWTLRDEFNPATGGLNLTFQGVPPAANDNNRCPFNPKTGTQFERTVTFSLSCDNTLPNNVLEVQAVGEPAPCQYLIAIRTGAACGCAPNCAGKICGGDGCGGYCSGSQNYGQCPWPQKCMPDQTCCRPDCTNRDCGDDGCGGSCGTCGSDELCNVAHVCVDDGAYTPPATAQIVYYTNGGRVFGAWFGGVVFSVVIALGVAWFTPGGRTLIGRFRQGGIKAVVQAAGEGASGEAAADTAALVGSSTGTPRTEATSLRSGGGGGGLASSGKGGYGT